MNRPRMAIKLPAPDRRWTAGRKRAVVTAIEQGLLTADDARQHYALSLDELADWQRGGLSQKLFYRLRQAAG